MTKRLGARRWLLRLIACWASFGAIVAIDALLGAGLLIAVAAGAVAAAVSYVVLNAVMRRAPADHIHEVGEVLRNMDREIEALSWVQIRLPPASTGKATLLRTCDAARAVAARLNQENSTLGRARRADRKLKTCVRIARWYQDLLCGSLFAETEQRRAELIKSIESEALPKITDQLLRFVRDLDESEIMDLEVELKVLDRMT
jgi:hypothetical protein